MQDAVDLDLEDVTASQVLEGLASTVGDISQVLSEDQLVRLGAQVVDDYEKDCSDREEWAKIAKDALEKAAQEKAPAEKMFPWHGASNANYPLLAIAGLQFNARSYPAIVKGDQAVSCKVVGADKGVPVMGPDGQPMMGVGGKPVVQAADGQAVVIGETGPEQVPEGMQPEPMWQRKPGAKAKRARRVSEYLNAHIFYRMEGWEADTDLLLMQLPIVGCAFRKVYYNGQKQCSKLVSALNLVVPMDTKEIKDAARISEIMPLRYPYQLLEDIKSGHFRRVEFIQGEDFTEKPRQLIEQHCRFDVDGDGYPEPYIVTVDHESREVCRVVAGFEGSDIERDGEGKLVKIAARQFYVKYEFFPHPEGKFYGIGLGHMLAQISGVIDRIINQMIDAGTAAVAGGGFIASGVRLQGTNRTSTIRMNPGEWKPVNVSGDALRNAMVERTFPNPSPVMYQILEMLLGAAQDISSIKDVLTGDASNNGQVGTTLALIEQGLQMFTAIYKRVYRSLKDEFQLLFVNVGKYATEEMVADYMNLLDDPEADFAADFAPDDMDIRPVSDAASVTNMQKMARAQFLMTFIAAPGLNPQAIYKRVFEAADIEDIDELFAPPPQPSEGDHAKMVKDMAGADKLSAEAEAVRQDMEVQRLETLAAQFSEGVRAAA